MAPALATYTQVFMPALGHIIVALSAAIGIVSVPLPLLALVTVAILGTGFGGV